MSSGPGSGSNSRADTGLRDRSGAPIDGTRTADAGSTADPGSLIGRREELGLLLQRFAEAREGHGQVLLVAGEPGIGKTRLARVVASRLAAEGWPVLECWCSAESSNVPLAPFVDLVGRLAAAESGSRAAPDLAGLEALSRRAAVPPLEAVPLLAELLSLPLAGPHAPLEATPRAKRERTFDALVALLLGLGEERPLALIAEDLQWADPSSLELVDRLIADGRGAPLMLVLTFRPGFEPPWAWREGISHLPLGPLDRAETEALVELAAAGSELPPAVRSRIVERAGGVPLFALEITRATIDTAAGGHGGDAAVAAVEDVPATLHDSLTARLDRLGTAKVVAQHAAALGCSFTRELLATTVSPVGEAALEPELERLVAAGLVRRSGLGWRATYEFAHALMRELAYHSLPEGDRRRLHATVVRELDEHHPDLVEHQPELIARHATAAGLNDRAVDLWQRAGRRAFDRSAGAEAVSHYHQALELVAARPPGAERDRRELELLTALGPALITAQGYTSRAVDEAYRRAGALCRRVQDPGLHLGVLAGVLAYRFSRAEYAEALSLLDSVRSPEASDELRLVEEHFRQGIANFSGEFAAARDTCERIDALSLKVAKRTPTAGHDMRTGVLSTDLITLWHLGYPERALERLGEARAWAHGREHPFDELFADHMGLWLRQLRGEPGIVAAEARELRERAAALELPYFEAEGEVLVAWAATCREGLAAPASGEGTGCGERREALARLRSAIARHEELGMRFGRTYRLTLLADACLRLGRLDEAEAALAEAGATAESTGERFRLAEFHRLSGELALARNGSDAGSEAEAAFRRALDTARGQRAKSLELRAAASLGRLWRRSGRAAEARRLVSPVVAWFTEGDGLADLVDARALLAEL